MSHSSPRVAFRHKLLAYTSASAAALVTTQAAKAQSILNITAGDFGSGSISLSTYAKSASFTVDGTHVFLNWQHLNSPGSQAVHVSGSGAAGLRFMAASRSGSSSFQTVQNLAKGAAIDGANDNVGQLAWARTGRFFPGANATKTGYVGFQKGAYRGWFGVKLHANGSGRIDSVAFYDKNGDGIYGAVTTAASLNVGDVGTRSIPEPANVAAGIGLLALGAAGLREHRRRKQTAA